MRTLILGAGAVGGYFGGRLLEKGEDVTFLVRENREHQLKQRGLIIKSKHGDVKLEPRLLRAGEKSEPFDVIIIATKAYHLQSAMEDVEPFMKEETVVIPLLNGIEHMEDLKRYFSDEQVLGGLCFIESTLNDEGDIIQTSDIHELVFGEWSGGNSARVKRIAKCFAGTKTTIKLSEHIQQDMWHKYLFISTVSGMTSLMRSSIGPILDTIEGRHYIKELFEEIRRTMEAVSAPIVDGIVDKQMAVVDSLNYSMKSSMLRDIEKKFHIEVDHLQGYLLLLAEEAEVKTPLLRLIHQHLKIYEKNL